MEIQSVHRQSFGRIIAPEKYIGQQIAKIKDEKGRQIARGLMHIVKQSDVVDIYVSKKGDVSLRYKEPYIRVVDMKSRKIKSKKGENVLVEALLRGAADHATNHRIAAGINGEVGEYNVLSKYASLVDAIRYGIANLTKTK